MLLYLPLAWRIYGGNIQAHTDGKGTALLPLPNDSAIIELSVRAGMSVEVQFGANP